MQIQLLGLNGRPDGFGGNHGLVVVRKETDLAVVAMNSVHYGYLVPLCRQTFSELVQPGRRKYARGGRVKEFATQVFAVIFVRCGERAEPLLGILNV